MFVALTAVSVTRVSVAVPLLVWQRRRAGVPDDMNRPHDDAKLCELPDESDTLNSVDSVDR